MKNISVRSIPKTFNRAGMKFTDKPHEIEVDEKTLAVLKAEPLLIVEILPDEQDGEKTGSKGKK